MRRLTKIVCTLGPSSSTLEEIQALADAGMNVARINLSHGTHEAHLQTINIVRKVNENRASPVGILLDTKGCEIRTGDLQTPLQISKDEEVVFCSTALESLNGEKVIEVNYDGFSNDVRETDTILLDNGELSFDILDIRADGAVIAKAREDGEIGSRRHVNLPGATIDLPSVTEKDWEDIAFAIEQDVDFIALSFIREAYEVDEVRTFLNEKKSSMHIITKVETAKGVENITEIIAASDGIMVARGDLGAEVPYERLPVIQDDMVLQCSNVGKPVIVATHMLESMREHPIPTRAEVTDIAHAAVQRADSTMLSGETASGNHPCKALSAMDRILRATEDHLRIVPPLHEVYPDGEYEARAKAAVVLAHKTDAPCILLFTRTGRTARQIAKFRPHVPIIACTDDEHILRVMTLLYGVSPYLVQFSDAEETIAKGMNVARSEGFAEPGDKIILVSDVPKELAEWSIQQRIV